MRPLRCWVMNSAHLAYLRVWVGGGVGGWGGAGGVCVRILEGLPQSNQCAAPSPTPAPQAQALAGAAAGKEAIQGSQHGAAAAPQSAPHPASSVCALACCRRRAGVTSSIPMEKPRSPMKRALRGWVGGEGGAGGR